MNHLIIEQSCETCTNCTAWTPSDFIGLVYVIGILIMVIYIVKRLFDLE